MIYLTVLLPTPRATRVAHNGHSYPACLLALELVVPNELVNARLAELPSRNALIGPDDARTYVKYRAVVLFHPLFHELHQLVFAFDVCQPFSCMNSLVPDWIRDRPTSLLHNRAHCWHCFEHFLERAVNKRH